RPFHRGRRRQDPDRSGVAGFPGRSRDRFHRRSDRSGLQGQQPERHLVLWLRHQLFRLMKIATWNVNSIKARLEPALAWLKLARPDVVALQEIKCLDDAFPREPFEALGYNCAVHGQKTYNGVALLSRRPMEDVTPRLPDGAPLADGSADD